MDGIEKLGPKPSDRELLSLLQDSSENYGLAPFTEQERTIIRYTLASEGIFPGEPFAVTATRTSDGTLKVTRTYNSITAYPQAVPKESVH